MIIKIGDIFNSTAKTLVNTINCVGVMGKGIALEFKKRYPELYKQYIELCENKLIQPGEPYYYHDITGVSIINFPTKDHWKSPSKLSYIISGLDWFVQNYKELGIESIAFPPLGCGNGGLSWEIVGPIMVEKLKNLPIYVEIYAPYGTKQELLSEPFLNNNNTNHTQDITGIKNSKINDKWLLILYVVQQLSSNIYSLKVGRTIFQKICYIMTFEGIETQFFFKKGSYGPYSPQINNAVMLLSNANLINENKLGPMITLNVSPNFHFNPNEFEKRELDSAKKTIDLFSRIKSTAQAEMISTVIYSYDELRKSENKITDHDIYKYIIKWKPQWENELNDPLKRAIQNLAMLNWITVLHDVDFESDDLL